MELISKLAHFSFVMVVLFITFGMCKNTTPPPKKEKRKEKKIKIKERLYRFMAW